jgi:hypothetical protein
MIKSKLGLINLLHNMLNENGKRTECSGERSQMNDTSHGAGTTQLARRQKATVNIQRCRGTYFDHQMSKYFHMLSDLSQLIYIGTFDKQ